VIRPGPPKGTKKSLMNHINHAFERIQGLKVGDFFHRGLPPGALGGIDLLIDAFVSSDPAGREQIAQRVEKSFAFAFSGYAHHAAIESIRRNDPSLLKRGLLALAIENGKIDWRDSLPWIALLYHSACKMGVDFTRLVHEVREVASQPFAGVVLGFLNRDEEHRTIESVGFRESGDGPPFDYVRVEAERKERPINLVILLRRLRDNIRDAFGK
jgi:hypothetical protein